MAKQELGIKRTCPKCSAKFYDLNKNPAHCPLCEHNFDPEIPLKKRGKRKGSKLEDEKSHAIAVQAASKKRPAGEDEDEIDLPEFDDLGIIEEIDDLDDMDEVEGLKSKPTTAEGGEEDEEGFIDDEDIIGDEDGLDEEFEGDEDER